MRLAIYLSLKACWSSCAAKVTTPGQVDGDLAVTVTYAPRARSHSGVTLSTDRSH